MAYAAGGQIEAQHLGLVDHLAVAFPLVAVDVGPDGGERGVGEGLVGELVDAPDRAEVVGHELLEADVHGLIGREQLAGSARSARGVEHDLEQVLGPVVAHGEEPTGSSDVRAP